ncbi:MAG: SDR family oxidoreductase [Bacteriovoracales bacterium]|nr:SDR family oxidoreductase [Bacteriovoracales bacterium]
MDLKLTGKRALVFGSSQGIGKAIALALMAESARVVISSRREETLSRVARETGAHGFFCADMSVPGDAERAIDWAMGELGGLDILVHNTGGPEKGRFLEISRDQWELDYQSLWLSVTESLKAVLPTMQRQQFGRIILVSSIAAKEPLPLLTTSNALRAGLLGLVKTVALEVAKDGVTVNGILPGYTATERLKALNLSDEQVKKMVAAGRLGEPQEMGTLAAYLASPLAGYITGQSIAVDGGALKGH